LFLDEPFAGLDLCTKRTLLEDISQVARAREITLVVVTHDPVEAFSLCSRAVLFEAGHIDADGTWRDVLKGAQSALLRAFKEHSGGGA
jgi:molybdate transport system ATP-binding protein